MILQYHNSSSHSLPTLSFPHSLIPPVPPSHFPFPISHLPSPISHLPSPIPHLPPPPSPIPPSPISPIRQALNTQPKQKQTNRSPYYHFLPPPFLLTSPPIHTTTHPLSAKTPSIIIPLFITTTMTFHSQQKNAPSPIHRRRKIPSSSTT